MKKILVILTFLSVSLLAKSQNLVVEGTAPNLYITHTVAPKENFYSVGRLYNQNAKAIASFNNLVMEKGLTIGQRIKIPLNSQNLDESESSVSGGSLIPLTHVVEKSETISKIGSDHNVSAQSIKQWNNLTSDNIAPGTPLVVGHLKISAGRSVATNNTPAQVNQPVAKQETFSEPGQPAPEIKIETTPAATQEPVKQPETGVAPMKEAPAKQPVVKRDEPKESAAPARAVETRKSQNYSYTSASNTLSSVEGVFANVYTADVAEKSINTKSGEAATFKSTSGWQDKKYYVLMNDVAPGTIVKIASTENKVVYAKVLGSMPDMKENNGLLLRISNAAASYLGIIDPKFPVQISYYQ